MKKAEALKALEALGITPETLAGILGGDKAPDKAPTPAVVTAYGSVRGSKTHKGNALFRERVKAVLAVAPSVEDLDEALGWYSARKGKALDYRAALADVAHVRACMIEDRDPLAFLD